jgi:hypothetical protein
MKIALGVLVSALSVVGGLVLLLLGMLAGATEPEMFDEYARFPVMLYGGLFLMIPLPLFLIGRTGSVRSTLYWAVTLVSTALLGMTIVGLLISLPHW